MRYFAEAITKGHHIAPLYDDKPNGPQITAVAYRGFVVTFTSEHNGAIVWAPRANTHAEMIGMYSTPEAAFNGIDKDMKRLRPMGELVDAELAKLSAKEMQKR